MKDKCLICGKILSPIKYSDGVIDYPDVYEYRGSISCENCFDKLVQRIDGYRKGAEEDDLSQGVNREQKYFKGVKVK